jgi:hypothetical protein
MSANSSPKSHSTIAGRSDSIFHLDECRYTCPEEVTVEHVERMCRNVRGFCVDDCGKLQCDKYDIQYMMSQSGEICRK